MILTYPNEQLNKPSAFIEDSDDAKKIVQALRAHIAVLKKKGYGVLGLAAPQIGLNYTVFIALDQVFINPVIYVMGRPTQFTEGCFSVPGETHQVQRYELVTISYTDESGTYRELKTRATPYDLGHVVQHEADHLKGLLINRPNPITGGSVPPSPSGPIERDDSVPPTDAVRMPPLQ